MADQVREAGFLTGELSAVLKDAPDHYSVVLSAGEAKALIAATASHAAEVEALKDVLRQCFDYPADHFDIPADEPYTMTVTGRHLHMVRAALKGDKP